MATFLVGVSRRDMTPKSEWVTARSIYAWGFGARDAPVTGVRDPLTVTALAISDGSGNTVVLASLDVGNIAATTTAVIRQRVQAATGIPGTHVCINVSHTHAAPSLVDLSAWWSPGIGAVYEPFRQLVEDLTVEAIVAAVTSRQPAELLFGRGSTQIGVERTGALPAGTTEDGVLDVLHARTAAGLPLATVFRASCHPVWARDSLITADFPGVARGVIEQQYGTSLFVQGFAGSCDPRGCPSADLIGDMGACGRKLAQDVAAVLAPSGAAPWTGMTRLAGSVDARSINLVHPYVGGAAPLDQEVQALFVGSRRSEWCLVGCAHEVTTDHATRAQSHLPGGAVTLAGYCNHQRGYVVSDAILARDTYEALGSNHYYGHHGSDGNPDKLQTGVDARLLAGIVQVTDRGWTAIGSVPRATALAAASGYLFCAGVDGTLWRRPATGDAAWEALGDASAVVGLAATATRLYCATSANALSTRPIDGHGAAWQAFSGAGLVVGMTAFDGQLYCATSLGGLWQRAASPTDLPWTMIGHAQGVVGLATARGRLLAAASGGLHWRTLEPVDQSWRKFATAPVVALTSLGDQLYAATAGGALLTRTV